MERSDTKEKGEGLMITNSLKALREYIYIYIYIGTLIPMRE